MSDDLNLDVERQVEQWMLRHAELIAELERDGCNEAARLARQLLTI
jgi:hypothetical protein